MKVTELVEIMGVFEAAGIPVSLFFGAHEVNKDAVAAKSTACPTITDAVDIVRQHRSDGFEAFPGRGFPTPGPQ